MSLKLKDNRIWIFHGKTELTYACIKCHITRAPFSRDEVSICSNLSGTPHPCKACICTAFVQHSLIFPRSRNTWRVWNITSIGIAWDAWDEKLLCPGRAQSSAIPRHNPRFGNRSVTTFAPTGMVPRSRQAAVIDPGEVRVAERAKLQQRNKIFNLMLALADVT